MTWIFSSSVLARLLVVAFFLLHSLPRPAKGFRLIVQRQGGAPLKLHEDASIPKSRGCPLRYAISDVMAYEPEGGSRVIAVLISVFAHGFEGPDRRFLAVTKHF